MLALVGESGSGKTTTGRVIVKLTRQTTGRIDFEGTDVSALWSQKELRGYRRRVQLIFQDPYETLDPKQSIRDFVAEPLEVNHIGTPAEREAKVIAALEAAGLRPGGGLRGALPARAVRRPAPAGRHRRRPGHGPRGHRRRRAGVDARRVDPDRAAAADARPARRARADLPVHHPRPVAGLGHRRPDRGHVPRQDHGDRAGRGGHPLAAQPVHAGARVGVAVARPARRRARARRGRSSRARRPDAAHVPTGCRFHPRCPVAFDRCRVEEPPLFDVGGGQSAACWLAEPGARVRRSPHRSVPA